MNNKLIEATIHVGKNGVTDSLIEEIKKEKDCKSKNA